MSQQPWFIH